MAAPITQLTAVLGRGIIEADTQVITADDLGFTRGDGVFDATRVVTADDGSSTVDHIAAHLARFARSIAGMDGDPVDEQAWRSLIAEAVEAWATPGQAILKIMWTRGQESSSAQPTEVLTITSLSDNALRLREGIGVAMLGRGSASDAYRDAPWLLGGVKSLSYGVNVAVKREAARRGLDEVLLISSDGFVMEGPNASLITLHDADGSPVLRSTPVEGTGILASITQDLAFRGAAAEGVATELRLQTPDEARAADAAWFVSSVRGAAPVTRFDDQKMPLRPDWTARIRGWIGF